MTKTDNINYCCNAMQDYYGGDIIKDEDEYYFNGIADRIPVIYCPWCGKKL